ncbi:ABC transporter ATP-binding protein [Brassicibacter mesophilus]|uniref:ABC transporter ATP-binding protein n=1 Tax=Brassicibacter mesophilus TaxID=745119 RepID=UPI003D2283C6
MEKLLEIKNLHVHYITEDEVVKAVNGLNLIVNKGESLGIVGETGAGKTTTAMSILQLIPSPPGDIVDGQIIYKGEDLNSMPEAKKRKIRGNEISMIFQDPMTALNPVFTVGSQIVETIRNHGDMTKAEAIMKAKEMLRVVGIDESRFDDYPHQFSGGMKQRVIIAMALACNPTLLIADEPTTALDVTIQAQVLELIGGLREKYGTSLILITHDLGVVAETCEKVAIMYAGEIVEYGPIEDLYTETKHPYTQGLFNSIPTLEEDVERLSPIKGLTPDPTNLPSGCSFHPRCPRATEICKEKTPDLVGEVHAVKCHHPLNS